MGFVCQLGYYNFLNDSFTLVQDLNDGLNLELDEDAGGLDLPTPALEMFGASNPRIPGERLSGLNYQAREVRIDLMMGPQASYAAMQGVLQNLARMQEAARVAAIGAACGLASGQRVALKLQPPGSSMPLYADVVAMHVDHADMGSPQAWVRLLAEGITVECICAPFLRGPRVTLMNALNNPGFEAPGGGYAYAFVDAFANANAYVVVAGSAPVVAANQMTLASGCTVAFGSAQWQAVAKWTVRFKWVTGLVATFVLHYQDANNYVEAQVDGANLLLKQSVSGVLTTLKTQACALTNGAFYWVQLTQFPAMPGVAPLYQAVVFNDSSGAEGSQVANSAVVVGGSATAAVAGVMRIGASGASLVVGGAFPGVHSVLLYQPSGWNLVSSGAGTGAACGLLAASGTYAGGPVRSSGAARVVAAPAGTLDAFWASADLTSATTVEGTAFACGSGVAWSAAAWVQSSGVASSCVQAIAVREFDASGNFLRETVLASVSGAQASYVQLVGSVTTGASCAYIVVLLRATDGTSASAGGQVTWDNAQLWLSRYGASMPYCEMAFASAPGQVMLSGLLGDVVAPCQVMIGTLPSGGSIAPGASLVVYAGRRAQAGAGAQLVGVPYVSAPDGVNDSMSSDSLSYAGYRAVYKNVAGDYEPPFVSGLVSDYAGMYHLLVRVLDRDGSPASINLRADSYLLQSPWFGNAAKTDRLGVYLSPFVFPFANASFTLVDVGLLAIPMFGLATNADPTQIYATVAAQSTNAAVEMDYDWGALVPVDGDVLAATWQPTYNVTFSGWIWMYFDGLAVLNAGQTAVGWSLEPGPLPNPAHAGGGVWASVAPGVTSVGDAVPRVDPQVNTASANGVNQWVVVVTDNAANVLPMICVVTYAPLYLQLR